MKHLKKLRFRELAVLLIVGVFLGLLFVQQVFVNTAEAQQNTKKFNPVTDQLVGSKKAPAGLQGLEKDKAPAKTEKRNLPTMKALMDIVSKQPGGKEKVTAAKAGKPDKKILQGSTKEPPDIEALNKGKKAPAKTEKRNLPTMKSLMDIVSKQPGGKEKIKRATTRGKKSGMGSEKTGILLSGLSELNPLKVKVAHAAGSILSLTPDHPFLKLSNYFFAYMDLYGVYQRHDYVSSYYKQLSSLVFSFGVDVRRPCVALYVHVPSPGWYLINFETYDGAKAYLSTYKNVGWPTIQKWDTRGPGWYKDHPVFLNLGSGWHSFFWVKEEGDPYIFRVTVQQY